MTEELLFRSASVPLMIVAQADVAQLVLLSPVIFGLAHVHHLYEFRLTNPQVPAAAAVLRSLFQFAYTTLFGAYATFLFVRTGSLLAVCAVHAFCNRMGLPRLWGRVYPPPPPPDQLWRGRDVDGADVSEAGRSSIAWTVAYYVLLIFGAAAWYRNLYSLTVSSNALLPESAFTSV